MEASTLSDVSDSLSESEFEQGSAVAVATKSSSPSWETAGIAGASCLLLVLEWDALGWA